MFWLIHNSMLAVTVALYRRAGIEKRRLDNMLLGRYAKVSLGEYVSVVVLR